MLLLTFGAYLWYLFSDPGIENKIKETRSKFNWRDLAYVIFGIIMVVIGAKLAVDMVINLSTFMNLPIGLVSIAAIAIGTSLPELFISLQSLRAAKLN